MNEPDYKFPAVAIGASAGGVKALQDFFRSLPDEENKMAFIVVMHLSTDSPSSLDHLIRAELMDGTLDIQKLNEKGGTLVTCSVSMDRAQKSESFKRNRVKI